MPLMSSLSVEEVGKRIRTLTSLLYKFNVREPPSKRRSQRDILPFLSHFTTLLACSDEDDRQAQKVVAVTGSIDAANQVRALIVSQNRRQSSAAEATGMSLKLVHKKKRPLEEVVKGSPNAAAPLVDHVADVWAALSAFTTETSREDDDDDPARLASLELFFLSRSYSKFVSRFKQGARLCGGRQLYEVIADWQPDCPEITTKWVRVPPWLLKFPGLPSIKSRVVQGIVEWEFSDDTKKAWSRILEVLLTKVDQAIDQVETARTELGEKSEEDLSKAMKTLNMWCRVLCTFVLWSAGIVKSLLTKTNLADSITITLDETDVDVDEDDDDAAEFLQERNESKGEQVYRYLKMVVAWHTAVFDLSCEPMLPQLLENIQIGLVEVPPSLSSVLSLPQIAEELFARSSDLREHRDQVLDVLRARYSEKFSGCTHAQAMLMGFVNYYAHEETYASCSSAIMNDRHMQNLVKPVADAGSAVISVSEKCCWCCDWLGRSLETPFSLPGTHGKTYPWDPPTAGVGLSVLQRLERALWEELRRVVLDAVTPPYSMRDSPPGLDDEAMACLDSAYDFTV